MAKNKSPNGANLGFEEKLWQAADKLRNNMDAAEYKHVVLGLIFLKYISDAFEERHKFLMQDAAADPEDVDEYKMESVFWVPKKARWEYLKANAKQPAIGKLIDDAMDAIEKDNPSLKGVLSKNYSRPALDKQRLGELIDLISTIGLGDYESRSKDILGRVYEYFLGQFADAEGKKGGQFYTPRSIVRILVELLEPYKGRVYDPCCGSGGMFVQSEKFVEAHEGRIRDISVYGQESNQTTWRLCQMNLAIRGIEANIKWGDTFHDDQHRDLKADFILANPPFNVSDWKGDLLREDIRWKFGAPPSGNANFAWVQHFIHHLSPTGIAGFVLANGSMSSNTSGEGEIRKNIVEADLIDCMIALPSQLFYNTMIPACLWFVARDKKNHKFRDRRGEVLFIDARKMGIMVDRRHRELTDEEIQKIASTYHAWRGEGGKYKDIPGFCKAAKLDEIRKHGHILTPGRYVGAEEAEDDVGFFQAVRSAIAKNTTTTGKPKEDLDSAIRQIISRAVASNEVVDIFAAAGLKKPDISILSDEFLAEVRGLPYKNLAFELLTKLLNDEIKIRSKKNLIQGRSFSEMLEKAIKRYHNKSIETARIIEELIELAKEMRNASQRGEALGLTEDELAFYDALEVNDSAVKVLGNETLRTIARELVKAIRKDVTIDWTLKESVKAQLRVNTKRILRKYGYPPDKQKKATDTVLEQAALLCRDWAEVSA